MSKNDSKTIVGRAPRTLPIDDGDTEKHPLWHSMMKHLRSLSDVTSLEEYYSQPEPIQTNLLSHRMLALPWRFFVIDGLKDPLRKVLILVGKRFIKKFGKITKETTVFRNTHALIDIAEKFARYERNHGREEMFQAGFDILTFENEHDPYYRFRFDWFTEEIVKAVLDGKWQPRPEGYPNSQHWAEPKPYGGKYSIIYKLQAKREEINKLLEEV